MVIVLYLSGFIIKMSGGVMEMEDEVGNDDFLMVILNWEVDGMLFLMMIYEFGVVLVGICL